ncbi:MAG: TonB family protein [Acidobacteriota bacterium]|nr:TonB family protein [Acidobacteriota bacterium]
MKTCPKCQQQYPNGFQYCPNDTELLMTTEEYVRRTAPLTSAPPAREAESGEVVPLAPSVKQAQASIPQTPISREAQPTEKSGGMPFRQTEQIRASQPEVVAEAPKAIPQQQFPAAQPIKQAPPQPVQQAARTSQPAQQQAAQPAKASSATNSAPAAQNDGFNLMIPQQVGMIENLITSLKNIGEIFKKGDYKPGAESPFLLKEESLFTSVTREVSMAAAEFKQNPKQFLSEFVRGEGSNRYRRNALLAGSELALVGYVTIYFIAQIISSIKKPNGFLINTFFIGFATYLTACYAARGFLLYKLVNRAKNSLAAPKIALEFFNWSPIVAILIITVLFSNYDFYCRIFPSRCVQEQELPQELVDVAMIDLAEKIDIKVAESAKAKKEMLGGSKSQPKQAAGGGGGGKNDPTPPSQGRPPQMALTPQIIPPDPEPPKIKNPSLVVASTIYGDPKIMPPMKGPIGDPNGIPAPPSSGPGSGGGIGNSSGTGVGGGQGGGLGPGRGGNTGGNDMALGGGRSVEPMSASLRPTILYKERAKYTEEARANKIQGSVLVALTYTADGRITDIKVVRGLPDGLTESAIEAAKRIRFQPAMKNGQPVSVRGQLEFNFTLY